MLKKKIIEKIKKELNTKSVDFVREGSYGQVFKVIDQENKLFAVKVIPKKIFFPQEIEMLKKVIGDKKKCHKHILCFINNFKSQDNFVYLWFEWIGGGNLIDFFEKHGDCVNYLGKVTQIIFQLVDAIQFLHEKDIAHRDIKADNVMLTNENNVKLVDFGLSCNICENNAGYMFFVPPVQHSNKDKNTLKQSKAQDLFAIGMTLSQLVLKHEKLNEISSWKRTKKTYMTKYVKGKILNNLKNVEFGNKYFFLKEIIVDLLTEKITTVAEFNKKFGEYHLTNQFSKETIDNCEKEIKKSKPIVFIDSGYVDDMVEISEIDGDDDSSEIVIDGIDDSSEFDSTMGYMQAN